MVFHIKDTQTTDSGHYTACVYNKAGRDVSSCQLFVETTGEVDEQSFVTSDTLQQLQRLRAIRKKKDYAGGIEEKHMRPHFRQIPSDVEAREGTVVRFDCVVTGRPLPEMIWLRDGVRVLDDDLHKVCAIFIKDIINVSFLI